MAKKILAKDNLPSEEEFISVFGAREHNLKNIDVEIPRNKLVIFTGVSGSGKSSLAFDTIYNEGQRRYMESFSAYARQFMGDMERPDVDKITGLSPVISIEQKTTNKNPRSTVGTITEIYDFLRLLFARASDAYSYNTGKKMVKFSEEEIVLSVYEKFPGKKISLLSPLVRGRKGHYRELFEDIRKKGFLKVRVDGEVMDLTPRMQLDRYKIHDIEVVVDRLQVKPDMKLRVSQSVQKALQMGKDLMFLLINDDNTVIQYSRQLMCTDTGISYEEPSPNAFSFNSPYGACPVCKGLGMVYQVSLEAVMPDTKLSVKEGGIAPLGEERNAYVYQQVEQVAKKHKINLNKPLKDLTAKALNVLLYGSEESSDADTTEVDMNMAQDGSSYYATEYEGVINMVKRWFASVSTSESIRSWAEQFMHLKTCDTCEGTRLRKESLWFRVAGKNIAELSNMDLDKLATWFEEVQPKLNKKQQVIAKDILKEIKERLGFLLNVGLTYLTLFRQSKTLSGGEYQRIRLATQIGSQLQGIT
ncbi:MAG: excinuclease ABC subunit UvrA, partial [Ferruginibacter sp.]